MRLTTAEVDALRDTVRAYDPQARVYLFGSHADDAARGGDIDLLIVSEVLGFKDKLQIKKRLFEQLGEQRIDIVIRRDTRDAFSSLVLDQAVPL